MNIITIIRWVLSAVCIVSSMIVICGNYFIFIQTFITKRWASLIPFIGGILGAIGLGISPIDSLRNYWWMPFLIDLGCVPVLTWTAIYHLFHHRHFISNTDAASIIINFLNEVETDEYAWSMIGRLRNDFSTPDLDLALELCSFFSRDTIRQHSEHITAEEKKAYKTIAAALSRGGLHFSNHKEIRAQIKNKYIPNEIKNVITEFGEL